MTVRRACRHWTAAEEKTLSQLWGVLSAKNLGERLGRSVDAIISRANRMGLGAPSRGTKALTTLCRETGYHPGQIRYAMRNLDMNLQFKVDMRRPGQESVYRQYAITFEQEEAILAYLAQHPDGERVYCNQPGHRTKLGQWGVGDKPPACLVCHRTDRIHRAHGMCGTCHMRLYRRQKREAARNPT